MDLLSPRTIYVAVVLLVGLGLLARALSALGRTATRRRLAIERRERFEAVRTKTPLEHPRDTARERGLRAVESQTTVIRRALVPVVLAFTALFAALPFVGEVPRATLTLLGAGLAVVIGIASRSLLENAIAGLVITGSRLMNIGDTVTIDDHYGTIEDITVTHTMVKIWDWRRYVVPNSTMLEKTIVNHSVYDRFRWMHVEFHVSHEADLDDVREAACEAVRSSAHFHDFEPPQLWVMELGKESVVCWAVGWADTPSGAWSLAIDTRTAIHRALKERGIASHGYRLDPPPVELAERPEEA